MKRILDISEEDTDIYQNKNIYIEGILYRRKKHPDAPKKPLNAYQIFINEKRSSVVKKNKNFLAKEIINILAKDWKNLNEKKKQIYFDKALLNKEKYFKEKESYTGEKNIYIRCNKKHKHFPKEQKRKLSEYNIFMSSEIALLKQNNPEKTHKEIFKEAVTNWNLKKSSSQ